MRLDGLGKPPLVQAQSDSTRQTKVRTLSSKEVVEPVMTSGPDTYASQGGQETGRMGQILDLLQKAQDRKKKKPGRKALSEAVKLYQKVANLDDIESQLGQAIDKRA